MSNSKFGFKTRLGQISNIIEAQSAEFPSTFDPDAEAFLIAADITDNTQKNAINNLVINLKAAEIWSKMKAIYPFVGGTAESHKWNLKDPRDLDAAFRLVFFGGWTHDINGAQPNGSNGYANTFLATNNMLSTSLHFSYYSRSNTAAGSKTEMGVLQDPAAQPSIQNSYSDLAALNTSGAFTRLNNGGNVTFIANPDSIGFYVGTRTASNLIRLFKNGSNIQSLTTNSNAVSTLPIYIGAVSLRGAAASFSDRECGFSSIGDGLTDSDTLLLNQIVETYQYELNRNVNPVNANYYSTAYNPETNTFLYASEITDDTQKTAINNLVDNLKTAGIWTKMKAIYPMIGGTAESHKWNLKDPQNTNAAYRLVFSGGWTHSPNGILGNGINNFANTYLSTSSISLNSGHVSFYSRTNNTSAVTEIGGGNSSPDSYTALQLRGPNNPANTFLWFNNTITVDNIVGVNTAAFFIGSRTTSNSIKLYRNNNVIINGSAPSNATSINPLYIGAYNDAGTSIWFSNRECAFASIGDGLTDTEAADFYTAVQTYQTTLGRQV